MLAKVKEDGHNSVKLNHLTPSFVIWMSMVTKNNITIVKTYRLEFGNFLVICILWGIVGDEFHPWGISEIQ